MREFRLGGYGGRTTNLLKVAAELALEKFRVSLEKRKQKVVELADGISISLRSKFLSFNAPETKCPLPSYLQRLNEGQDLELGPQEHLGILTPRESFVDNPNDSLAHPVPQILDVLFRAEAVGGLEDV